MFSINTNPGTVIAISRFLECVGFDNFWTGQPEYDHENNTVFIPVSIEVNKAYNENYNLRARFNDMMRENQETDHKLERWGIDNNPKSDWNGYMYLVYFV